jgi:type II secretory pathway pseudopilin PulG
MKKYFNMNFPNRKNHAYTLVETVVVIALFSLIMLTVNTLIVSFYRQNDYAVRQSAAIQNGRTAVTTLVQDLREATVSESGSYPLIELSPNTIRFYSDIDRDEAVEEAYYYVNAEFQLVKETIEPSGNPAQYLGTPEISYIANYIQNDFMNVDIFKYYDGQGVEITNLDDADAVRFIEVNLVVNVDPTKQPEEFILRSSAFIRNLRPTLQ